jgi:hypothetical protein
MRTSSDPQQQRIQEATQELLSLPKLDTCAPRDAIRALTRSHLELSIKANNGHVSPSIDDLYQKNLASIIESEYRASVTTQKPHGATCFLHSTRVVPGYHLVAPQLCFLAEVYTPRENGSFVWRCHSPLGSFSYSQGPVVTHVQTALHEHAEIGIKRHFCQTPLFSAAAFKEDIQRLESRGAKLTFGLGPPSYSASLIVQALAAAQTSKRPFEPSCIGSLEVNQRDEHSASVRIVTSCYGMFTAEVVRDELGVCQATARPAPKS